MLFCNTYHLTWVSLTLDVVSLHGCSSKAQPLLLTLDEVYLLTATTANLELEVNPLVLPVPIQPTLHGRVVSVLIFTRKTDTEAATPVLCQTDAKNCLIGKDPDARKDECQGEGDERG